MPIITATGWALAFGAASWVIEGGSPTVFLIGLLIMVLVMYKWWSIVIDENMRALLTNSSKSPMYWVCLVYFL